MQLNCDTQQRILKYTAIEQAVNERRINKRKTTTTTASFTTNEVNPGQNLLVATIINGLHNASRHKQPQSTQMIRYPSNGSQITAAANVTNNNNSGRKNYTSIITYDNLGNPL